MENIGNNEIYEKYISFLENNPSVIVGEKSIREVVNEYGLGPFSQYLRVTEIHPLEDYRLWCRLSTGETKILDFTPYLEWEMSNPLKDKAIFGTVHAKNGCISWTNEDLDIDIDVGITYIINQGVDAPEYSDLLNKKIK